MADLTQLPGDLPIPKDDGACDHLKGMEIPDIMLRNAADEMVNVRHETRSWCVIYCYPMTGRPDVELPEGWEQIPGARGCTPQTCEFRDRVRHFHEASVKVVGLSTQSTAYQKEMVQRLCVPFPVLSDEKLRFTDALRLPTFSYGGEIFLRRLTLVCQGSKIIEVFYPVFPPSENANNVLKWIKANAVGK